MAEREQMCMQHELSHAVELPRGRSSPACAANRHRICRQHQGGPGRPARPDAARAGPPGHRHTGRRTALHRPVRLLISELTLSAGETFTEALMGRAPAPTRTGSTTQGVFSDDMERTLPNDWTFTLANEEYLAPDGKNYEGVGIPPSVPVFTAAELAQHQDSALGVPW